MKHIIENYQNIKSLIPQHVELVAVSKTKPAEFIKLIYDEGHRVFGENRVQELIEKYKILPKDIRWHMIGHLQSKKVKHIAPFISLIHAVDSIKLIQTINKEAIKNNRTIDCLLQLHIAKEESKYGFKKQNIDDVLSQIKNLQLKNVRICGVMGMATFTSDLNQVRSEFKNLKQIYDLLKRDHLPEISIISMGMSGDYSLAIEEGSNMIRVGSSIFGIRN